MNLPKWTKLGKTLESTIRKALFDYALLDDVDRLAIALSGGKDSLTLLHMLKAILGRGFPNIPLVAIHVSGAFSCGAGVDSAFLKKVCLSLDVPLIIRESKQTLETLACYSCSRERRKLIFDAAKEAGASTVAFGHHRDDHVQTLLMNLLHKGEFAGNLPKIHMHHYATTLIRPLIYAEEKMIYTFAKEQGFARLTCQCPVGAHSMRKKTDQLISEVEALFPNARSNLAKAGLLYGSQKASSPSGLDKLTPHDTF